MIQFLIKHFVKEYDDVTNPKVRKGYGKLLGWTGIVCNVLLFAIKIFAGFLTGSVAVMADAFNNLADSASSVVTMIGFKIADIPEDMKHPYGHGRVEYLSGLFISTAILATGIELFKTSIEKIQHPANIVISKISIGILLVSIFVKLWLAAFNYKAGKRIQSEAMKATAIDSLSDCISTLAVLAGMGIMYVSGKNLDGWFGAIVAAGVFFAGFGAARETIQPLIGMAPDPQMVEKIRELVLSEKKIQGVHGLYVHDYGPGRRMISLHAEMSSEENIVTAHEVIDYVERQIKKKFNYEAVIHIDPIVVDDPELNQMRKLVNRMIHARNEAWTVHDLKILREDGGTNIIFDLVVSPEELSEKDKIEQQLVEDICRIDPGLHVTICVEQDFISK